MTGTGQTNPDGIDPRAFRRTLGRFATGVTVITAVDAGGEARGMTANAFMSLSLEPPLVGVAVGQRARMHDLVAETGRFGVSILDAEQETLSRHFAGDPHFETVPFVWHEGLPLLAGALGHIAARVVEAWTAGDHTLYVGRVQYLAQREGEPLLFYGGSYRHVTAAGDPARPSSGLS